MNADKIRVRCATVEAAEYTLFVRKLIDEHYDPGGQAEILRIAAYKGILPIGATRKSLSEQIGGRYRHGPPWLITDMIIDCLPDTVDRPAKRVHAYALHQAAQRHNPRSRPAGQGPENAGPKPEAASVFRQQHRRLNSADRYRPNSGQPARPDAELRAARSVALAAEQRAHRAESLIRAAERQIVETHQVIRELEQRAGAAEVWAREADLRVNAIRALHLKERARYASAGELADLRETCALLAVWLEQTRVPITGRAIELTDPSVAALLELNRNRFTRRIDPAMPLSHRLLASYLGTYAELTASTCAALSQLTGCDARRIEAILAARDAPIHDELTELVAALGAVERTARTLAELFQVHQL